MQRFQGKTVLISGAAGNLGKAVAARFALEGARLILADLNADALLAAKQDLTGEVRTCALDLTDRDAVTATIAALGQDGWSADVFCAIAGGFDMGPAVHESSPELWQKLHTLNVETLLPLLAAVVPGMIAAGGGKIVTIGANAALKGMPAMGAYCAAKSTVMRITESAAAELRDKAINVNSVLPSIIDTPENRAAMPDADPSHWVHPNSLAGIIAFLASSEADAIHGALIPVTGLS